jgi:hypothetical protein
MDTPRFHGTLKNEKVGEFLGKSHRTLLKKYRKKKPQLNSRKTLDKNG